MGEPTEDSEMLYMLTQESKQIWEEDEADDCEEGDVEEEAEYDMDDGPEGAEAIRKEDADLSQKIVDMKRKKSDSHYHCEGDTEEEDLFYDSDGSDSEDCNVQPQEEIEVEEIAVREKKRKKPCKPESTSRSHCSEESSTPADFVPSSDSGTDADLGSDDDDGAAENLAWVLPSNRKSRAKKKKPRQWYDETRMQPEEQLCLKMCILDVYQFRRALQKHHIAQLRNFRYHRNNKDRIIAKCSEEGCPNQRREDILSKEDAY
jgi:hypothetical protein